MDRNRSRVPASSRNEQMKNSKNGRRKKARRKEAVTVIAALVLVIAVAVVCFFFFFKTQEISVENSAERYSDESIIDASGINVGDSMMRLKTSSIADRIEKSLPYIEKARIKRKYPDRVIIYVEYARASIALETPDGYTLMNNSCKVLQTGVQTLSDYVALLYGAELAQADPGHTAVFTDPDMLTYVSGLSSSFAENGFLNVTAYDLSDIFNITVEIDYKIDVKLGGINKAEGKLRFGREVIERTLKDAAASSSKLIVDLTGDKTAYVRSAEKIEASLSERNEPSGEDAENEPLSSVEPSESQEEETSDSGE